MFRSAILTFIVFVGFMGCVSSPQAASDIQWTFDNNGESSWRLDFVSSTQLYSASLPASNPTMNLVVGVRYGITVVNFSLHPFQVIAKGPDAFSDTVLLSASGTAGSFESDPNVDWTDNGSGGYEFTLTAALADAMSAEGQNPGYRCGIHTTTMRGDFEIFGNGEPIDDPIAESIPVGTIAVRLRPIITGLAAPLGAAFPDDGSGDMYIFDQAGTVTVLSGETPQAEPLLDVSDRLVNLVPGNYDERGFLGFALHPNYVNNRKVYTHTSEPNAGTADFTVPLPAGNSHNHQEVIAEWTLSPTGAPVRREIMRIDSPQSNHNGGTIVFGPDGYLYIGMGDGGSRDDDDGIGHDGEGNGQNPQNALGAILRIDVDGNNSANGAYGIPPDNPFVSGGGLPEIIYYGLRNPYAFSFDTLTGDIYIGDVGQNDIEELDMLTSDQKGANLGWRYKEGSFFFDSNGSGPGGLVTRPVVPLPPDLVDPIAEYDHNEGASIIGGFVYRGSAIPELDGVYVTGDYAGFTSTNNRLFYLDTGNVLRKFQIVDPGPPTGTHIIGFAQDREGELYLCGSTEIGPFGTSGVVYKILPEQNAAHAGWPALP